MKNFVLLCALIPTLAMAQKEAPKELGYRWHDTMLANGQIAVVKVAANYLDATNRANTNSPRLVVEKLYVNGQKAVRLFDRNGYQICNSACGLIVAKNRYNSYSSSSWTNVAKLHGSGVCGSTDSNGACLEMYILSDTVVDYLWKAEVFDIIGLDDFTSSTDTTSGSHFNERMGISQRKVVTDPEAPWDDLRDNDGTTPGGVVQNLTTDGWFSTLFTTHDIRSFWDNKPKHSQPRHITVRFNDGQR